MFCFFMFCGWFEPALIYRIKLLSFLYGLYVLSFKFTYRSKKSVLVMIDMIVTFRHRDLKSLKACFLNLSTLTPVRSTPARPSSRYRPRYFWSISFSSLLRTYNPTIYAVSAPSYDPIVTSKSELFFLPKALHFGIKMASVNVLRSLFLVM